MTANRAETTPELIVADLAAWRCWLADHATASDGVWLVLAKKGTAHPTSLTYDEALEEALCHGWVDGQLTGGHEGTFRRRFPEGTPTVDNPPAIDTAPKCCKQRTITVHGDVTPKIRQRLYWGSDEWIAAFVRRTRIEGGYGNIKSSKTENVRRGWTHVVGIVKTGLMLVIAQAAANLRCLRVWAARTGDRTDPLT
jgi:hypothetical protein